MRGRGGGEGGRGGEMSQGVSLKLFSCCVFSSLPYFTGLLFPTLLKRQRSHEK